jgi:AcrR family transcriptional regulator
VNPLANKELAGAQAVMKKEGTFADFDALRDALVARHAGLPKRLQQIARFALDHPDDMALGTVAEVARAAGVQPSALVRFAQARNALMAEIARRGFEQFAAELEGAWNGGRPDPVAAIENCGKAYLAFARREPASYAAMFDPGMPLEDDPGLLVAADRSFAVLREAAELACSTQRKGARPPPLMLALHIWSLSHGIASLFVGRADGARRKLPMSPEELLEAEMLIYLRGLGFPTDRRAEAGAQEKPAGQSAGPWGKPK